MEEGFITLNNKKLKGIFWEYDEFYKVFNTREWKRQWKDEEFLKQLGLSKPIDFIKIGFSGTKVSIDEETHDKEIAGADILRKDIHGDNQISAYHFPFYKIGDKIFMPTRPLMKLKGEHHVKNEQDFENKHREDANFKKSK